MSETVLKVVKGEAMPIDNEPDEIVKGDLSPTRRSVVDTTVGDVGDTAKSIASSLIAEVDIETTISKSTVKPFDDSKPNAGANFAEKLLRPKITVKDRQGNVIYVTAPYGEPKETGSVVKGVGIVAFLAGLGLVFGAGRMSKSKRR